MPLKAFDLVPVITSITHDVGDPSLKIRAVEAGGADLYLGTSSGLVVHYQYQVDKHDRTVPPSSALLNCQQIGTAAVTSLCLASALELLLVLVDDTVLTLHASALTSVDGYQRLRGVNALAANPNPRTADPFSIQVCCARRRQLLVLNVTSAGVETVRELSVPERAQAVAINGDAVCAAAAGQYLVFQVSTGRQQPLFQYDPVTVRPLVRSVYQDEFLVLGPAGLAMFALVTGTSERPPVQLGADVRAWSYRHPYIVATQANSVSVVSVSDERQRQEVALPESALVGNFDGQLLVCAGATVLALCPVEWQAQVQTLLRSGELEAAATLLESSAPSQQAGAPLRRTLGLQLLVKGRPQRASELLRAAGADPRELLSLVPGLLPPGTTHTDTSHVSQLLSLVPGLLPPGAPHDSATLLGEVPALAELPEARLREFLREYLLQTRADRAPDTAVDTALVLLLAEDGAALSDLLSDPRPVRADPGLCEAPLTTAGRAAELGQLLLASGQEARALQLWTDLLEGRQRGDSGDALRYMTEALTKTEDGALLRRHADAVLEADPRRGAGLFMARPPDLPLLMTPDEVCVFLKRHPAALTQYLHHRVVEQGDQSESLATQLAGLYLDRVVQLRQRTAAEDASEDALQPLMALLQSPAPLRVSALLHRTVALRLDTVTAHLYARNGEFEKALELMSSAEGGGPGAALAFALQQAPEPNTPLRRRLFHALLEIRLRSRDDVSAAVDLLNTWGGELDPARALSSLPAGWSSAVVGPFLLSALRRRLQLRHSSAMQRALAAAEGRHWRSRLQQHQRRRILLPANTYCPVCHRPLSAAVTVYPNGTTVHPDCADSPHRCPVTGQLFTTSC